MVVAMKIFPVVLGAIFLVCMFGCGDEATFSRESVKHSFVGSCCLNGSFYDCPSKGAVDACGENGSSDQCVRNKDKDGSCNVAGLPANNSVGVSVGGAKEALGSEGGCQFPNDVVELKFEVDDSLGDVKITPVSAEAMYGLKFFLYTDRDGDSYGIFSSYNETTKTGSCRLPKAQSCRTFATLNEKVYVKGDCPKYPQILLPKNATAKVWLNGKLLES